ncbi:MAG: peptide chain release factor N(5)-glutamine methyltransferase [Deltaproteobacteria bacterium]|nr:peptide chain release factor N(5)-glutamine methyltransferase [Deltaproteobacteria bacterium]
MSEVWTSLRLIQWTTDYFSKGGIPNPRLDAELLLAHILKCARIDLYLKHDWRVGDKDLSLFRGLLQRRIKREPLQYIIGETEFYGLKFKVTPDVLIPRPETELLVEEAIKQIGAGAASSPPTKIQILEIGTGSGCIAIALAKNIPHARITATDISDAALEIAQGNVIQNKAQTQIDFILSNIAPWRTFEAENRQFDLILSNPPYIAEEEIDRLEPEIKNFEPRQALNGGPFGLTQIQKIIQEAPPSLKEEGILLLEIGEDQGKEVARLIKEIPCLSLMEIKKDLSGRDRVVITQKRVTLV